MKGVLLTQLLRRQVFAISIGLIATLTVYLAVSDSVDEIAVDSTVSRYTVHMGKSNYTVRLAGYTVENLGKYRKITVNMIYMRDRFEVEGDPVVIYVTGNRFTGGKWSSSLGSLL